MKTMYDKHHEIKDEAYKMLRKLVGLNMSSTLINKLTEIRNDLNTRYKGEYHVEFVPVGEPTELFVVRVKVNTVH